MRGGHDCSSRTTSTGSIVGTACIRETVDRRRGVNARGGYRSASVPDRRQVVFEQEEADDEFQISVADAGSDLVTRGTVALNWFKVFDLRGAYMLSNLLHGLSPDEMMSAVSTCTGRIPRLWKVPFSVPRGE